MNDKHLLHSVHLIGMLNMGTSPSPYLSSQTELEVYFFASLRTHPHLCS